MPHRAGQARSRIAGGRDHRGRLAPVHGRRVAVSASGAGSRDRLGGEPM